MEPSIAVLFIAAALARVFFLGAGRRRTSRAPAVHKGVLPSTVEEALDEVLQRLANGELGRHFSTSLPMRNGERLVFALPEIERCEEQVVNLGGEYHGFSTRLSSLDTGTLTLTNQRLVFVGEKRAVEYPLHEIVVVDGMENGIALKRTGSSRTAHYVGTDVMQMKACVGPSDGGDWGPGEVTWRLTDVGFRRLVWMLLQEGG